MRADRLVSMLMLLQRHGKMSARCLAQELEVSVRTVFRDMQSLSAAGVPVYMERGSAGGCCLVDGYKTDLTGMTADELRALLLLSVPGPLQSLEVGGALQSALQKLAAASPGTLPQRNLIHVDWSGSAGVDAPQPLLERLYRAVCGRLFIQLRYLLFNNVEMEQRIQPLGLVASFGRWYLVGRTPHHTQHFPLHRIVAASVQEETFPEPDGFDLSAYWKGVREEFSRAQLYFTARARVSPQAMAFIQGILQMERIEPRPADPEGWEIVDLHFDSIFTARSQLLGWGAAIEVISPPELRWSMCDVAQQILNRYGAQVME